MAAAKMELSELDRELAAGEHGPGAAFGMDVLVRFGKALDAPRLLDITQAHIDGCLYHGQVNLDFIDRLVRDGGKVRVPATLNVGSMDLLHPNLVHGASAPRNA